MIFSNIFHTGISKNNKPLQHGMSVFLWILHSRQWDQQKTAWFGACIVLVKNSSVLILSHSNTDIVQLQCSASGRIRSRGVEFSVCVVSKTCELSLILPCVKQMINDNLNNEATCILEKKNNFLDQSHC